MKIFFSFLIFTLIFLIKSSAFSENINIENGFVWKNGLIYKKFSKFPFTGEVSGKKDKGFFKNGKPFGEWFTFYDNGQLLMKYYYKDGKKDGLWETFYEEGQLHIKENWKKGLKEGYYETYYNNGNLEIKGNYTNGKKEGIWNFFLKDGSLKTSIIYHKGLIINKNYDKKIY